MQIKRFISSLFLLLVYSLGFAHNLIPHCHDVNEAFADHSELGHHHHEHSEIHDHDGENHEHVAHGSHVDEGLYDFLVCILFEMEHQEHGSVLHFLPTTIKVVNSTQPFLVVLSNLSDVQEFDFIKPTFKTTVTPGYFSPLIGALSLRGPPSN